MAADPDAPGQLAPVEIEALVRHLVGDYGLRKVRLSGGEPTGRAELPEVVRRLRAVEGLVEVALTTNGLDLARLARPLAAAGLSRVNVSLDSLDAGRFRRITGVDGLGAALAGIDAAAAAGLGPVKINTVVLAGINDDEPPALVDFAAARGAEIRFIELMPMGPLAGQWQDRYVPAGQVRQTLAQHVRTWQALPRGSESAARYRATLADGRAVAIGFITPMSGPFCGACDRLRVACDGTFYPCLMDRPAGTLLPALRPRFDGGLLDELLLAGLARKRPLHPAAGFAVMTHIGG